MANYYASPSGVSSNSGTIGSPWDLQTALSNGSQTLGDTLYLRDGTYYGKFASTLTGGTVRSYPGEWAIIDGYWTTTLNGAIDASQTTFALTDASAVLSGGGLEIWIDNEVISIYGKSGNTITSSVRNAEGTVGGAASHANGATVKLVSSQQLLISGTNTTYRDFEVTTSLPNRTTIWGKMRGSGISNFAGSGNSFINLLVHDNVTGIFTGSSSANTLLYGNLLYNNGMQTMAPYYGGEARGGNLYLENASGYSRLYDVISINGFTFNGQLFGVSGPYIGGDVQGSVFANCGGPVENVAPNYTPNLYIGTGAQQIPYASVDSTYIWHRDTANTGNLTMGYSAGMADGDVTNSIFVGSLNGVDFNPLAGSFTGNICASADASSRFVSIVDGITDYTLNNNTYYNTSAAVEYRFIVNGSGQPGTWNSWRSYTGYDSSSTLSSGTMPDMVIVRPNAYEAGRANIIIYTSSAPTSINVNLTNTGLGHGQGYVIKNAFDWYGGDVTSGVYNSGSPTISMPLDGNATNVATPTGLAYTADTTAPNFVALVVIPTDAISSSVSGNAVLSNAIIG